MICTTVFKLKRQSNMCYQDNTHQSENMADTTKIKNIKLAQFEAVISENKLDSEKMVFVIERLIDQGLNVNYRLKPIDSFKFKSTYTGSTALHLALDHGKLDVFSSLLKHGADFTIKNDEGKTVIHQALDRSFYCKEACWSLQGQLKHPFIDVVLEKQICSKNSANPYSKDGLSHFHAACMTNNAKAVKFFLKNRALVNEAIDRNSKIFPGYTPLHLAVRYSALEVVKLLLDYDADLHFKNTEGMNPLHMLLEWIMQIVSWLDMGKRGPCKGAMNQFTIRQEMLLHMFNTSYTYYRPNYVDDIGFSSLHIGCFEWHCSVIKNLFHSGKSMTQAIRLNSPLWPGYTALHFAVQCWFEVAMYLLEKGADILAKDGKGVTPFDLILKLYEPKFIHSVILSQSTWKNIVFSDRKTKLADLVLAMNSQSTFESFLKHINASVNVHLPVDSPIWPGFTPLHLAVIFPDRTKDVEDLKMDVDLENDSSQIYNCSEEEEKLYFERIKICVNLGADITIKNAEGSTPLHLAFKRQKEKVIDLLLQFHQRPSNPEDKTGVSHLHIACAARNVTVAEKLLLEGADVGGWLSTSLSYRRIYYEEKLSQATLHFQIYHFMSISRLHVFHLTPGSTPLHIAVAAQCPKLVDTLLKNGADVHDADDNGLTPLHRMLTVESPREFAGCLESLNDLRNCIIEHGLSHLHVACLVGSKSCVRRLLKRGANVEAIVTYRYSKFERERMSRYDSEFVDPYADRLTEPMSFLAPYSGYRPLHFAVRAHNPSVVKVLLQHNADVLAKNAEGSTPLYDAFADEKSRCRDLLIAAFESQVDLERRMRRETGLTVLHFLCFLADVAAVKDRLKKGVDVNARAREDSPLWAGCTPLHVLMKVPHEDDDDERVRVILDLMLARGADVKVLNVDDESPVHVAYSRYCCDDEADVRAHSFIVDMLRSQRDFSVNPVSHEGISHFHVACMWDVEDVVERFLNNGIDPDDPVEYFKKSLVARLEHSNVRFSGGSSPIQLALIHRSKKVFNLLLKWGVNLQAVDCQGKTPLHVAACHIWQDDTYFREIFEYMKFSNRYYFRRVRQIDLLAEDIYGRTPLETLMGWNEVDEKIIEIFIKEGCRINAFNSVTEEGCIAMTIPNLNDSDEPGPIFELLMKAPNALEIDVKGRNAIHNVVSIKKTFALTEYSYMRVINRLRLLGCDIDLQDCSGRTPLHLAMQLQNFEAVIGLLEYGADINLLDANKKSAFSYTQKWENRDDYNNVMKTFFALVYQCHLCELYVNQINNEIYLTFLNSVQFQASFKENRLDELARLRQQKIDAHAVTLRDFLSETGAVAAYPHVKFETRQAVDDFFQARDIRDTLCKDFHYFAILLLLQYRKACKRVDLLKKAAVSLDTLTGSLLPYLCSKSILKFLSNADLSFLIASTDSEFIPSM